MVNLPSSPLKEFFVDDDDEFIKEATRKRSYSEPCWCGSNIPYKKCHRVRAEQQRWSLGKILNKQRKVFWKKRGCMHPDASPSSCRGMIIDAHTIQRKGPLSAIVDESNHLCHLEADLQNQVFELKSIGWKKASIFPGFCSHHDTELFKELETKPFEGTNQQCVLQSFRNVCCELYKKRALVESLSYQSGVLDNGLDIHRQIEIQMSINKNIEGQRKSIEELEALQNKFHKAIESKKWDSFECKVFYFRGNVELISAAAIQVDYDFDGNQHVDLFDLEDDAESIVYTTLTVDDGGALIFCWPREFSQAKKFVDSFDAYKAEEKGDVFAQYCFLSSEHTFFSKNWWEKLTESQKTRIYDLYRCTFYEGGKFIPSIEPLVDWVFE
ncbi:MAG: SEC-C domain-containing protein [Gammaproteobacteria bacterium]|nr:SEC-C domain-containing protein [Gammaproteobacteria bacterium]